MSREDITRRLRRWDANDTLPEEARDDMWEAAAEIARLRTANEFLRSLHDLAQRLSKAAEIDGSESL